MNNIQKRLLVVEDSKDIWILLQVAIRLALPDFNTIHAKHVAMASEYLQQPRSVMPSLILHDLYAPDRAESLAHLEAIRQPGSQLRDIPVIVMSSSTAPADIEAAYRAGCISYLVKPLKIDDWVRALKRLQRYLPNRESNLEDASTTNDLFH